MPDSAQVDHSTADRATNDSGTENSVRESLVTPTAVRALCVLGIVAVLGDLVTTIYGLDIGLQERNPFVVYVLSSYGVAGLAGLKLVAVAWVAIIWRVLGRRYGVAAMAGLMIPQTVAVVLNVVTILTA